MVAIARISVNHDSRGGSAPDSLVSDQGSRSKQRKVDVRVGMLPGPPGFLLGPLVQVQSGSISEADIAAWPYSVSLLCKFSGFLSSLHWPADAGDMGHFGGSLIGDSHSL